MMQLSTTMPLPRARPLRLITLRSTRMKYMQANTATTENGMDRAIAKTVSRRLKKTYMTSTTIAIPHRQEATTLSTAARM
jgi:hypothetical protein